MSIFRCLSAIWLVCAGAAAGAAEIKISDHPSYRIILEGTIVPGDYDKLRKLINENCLSTAAGIPPPPSGFTLDARSTSCPSEIYLASPGGSVTEAIKIGRLVRKLRLGVEVPAVAPADLRERSRIKLQDPNTNYLCASACFFVAVAGIERWPLGDQQPYLGIHRPFMTDADLQTLGVDQTIASATQVRALVETYLKEMGVPLKYVDLMFSTPRDKVRWITIEEYQADFAGIASELKDWMDARCDKRTEIEKRLDDLFDAKLRRGEKLSAREEFVRVPLIKQLLVRIECKKAVKNKMREDAWKAHRGL